MDCEYIWDLEYDDGMWFGSAWFSIIGNELDDVMVTILTGDAGESIARSQTDAFESMLKALENGLDEKVRERLISYYNDELKYSYGDDDMWVDIDDDDDLAEQVENAGAVIPETKITDEKKRVYLMFSLRFEDDKADGNEIAVEITDGEITDIGDSNIAFKSNK